MTHFLTIIALNGLSYIGLDNQNKAFLQLFVLIKLLVFFFASFFGTFGLLLRQMRRFIYLGPNPRFFNFKIFHQAALCLGLNGSNVNRAVALLIVLVYFSNE